MTLSDQELYIGLAAHGLVYGFLSRAFYSAPSREFIDNIAGQAIFGDWPLPAGHPDTQAGLKLLRTFCEMWDGRRINDLVQDYNRLFVGPEKLLAPPWESVYRSPDHLVFEQETLSVRRAYAQFGLQAPRQNVEPDDHIGLELAFVVHLCSLALRAIEQGQQETVRRVVDAQRAFLSDHLTKWANEFAVRVIENATTDYYRGVAHLLIGCLEETQTLLRHPAGVNA